MLLIVFPFIAPTAAIVGRPMYYLGMCLFEKHNLMVILELDSNKVMRFLGWF